MSKKRKLCVLLLLSIFLCIIPYRSQAYEISNVQEVSHEKEKSQEFRSVWISHFINDIPQYQEKTSYMNTIDTMLDNLESLNINTIIFHVRSHNNAFYLSDLNPIAKWYSKVDFEEFDPLTYIINECHKRNIEFHAWMNPYRVSSLSTTTSIDDVVKSYENYPSNPASDINNLLYSSTMSILNPGLPLVREFILKTIDEFLNKYDVDAIHFDDYFYISGIDDTKTIEEYNINKLLRDDFRREQVNILIKDISSQIKEYNITNNKAVQFGISPSSTYKTIKVEYTDDPVYDENGSLIEPEGSYAENSNYSHYFGSTLCDTKKWIDNEWIDYIMPQVYGNFGYEQYDFDKLTSWWADVTRFKKTNLYIGVGSAYASTLERGWTSGTDLSKILSFFQTDSEFQGFSYFNYKSLVIDNELMNDFRETNNLFKTKKIPGPYLENLDYVTKTEISSITYNKESNTYSWDINDNNRGYIIWKVPKLTLLDITSATYLYCYTKECSFTIIDNDNDYYVSSVNKANYISEPLSLNHNRDSSDIISYIDNIEDSALSTAYIKKINDIMSLFSKLTEEEQKKVTNFNKLDKEIKRIQAYQKMNETMNEYLGAFQRDFDEDYVLLNEYKNYSITWEEKSFLQEDNKIIHRSTGPYLVKIRLTFKDKTNPELDTITKQITINIGKLISDNHYLFYRNASGAMFKEDPQDYDGGFIGWNGTIISYFGYQLFIANGNYLQIKDNTVIPTYRFPSCAIIYDNLTNDRVTLKTETLNLKFDDLGYIIVNKETHSITSLSSTITDEIIINSNEYLFIPRVLDLKMISSPWSNINTISLLNKVYLSMNLEISDIIKINTISYKINNCMRLLNKDFIDKNNLDYIKNTYLEYMMLTESEKALLINEKELLSKYEEVKNYEVIIEARKEEIERINSLNIDYALYSEENTTLIKKLINDTIVLVTNESDLTLFPIITEDLILSINNIKTISEEEEYRLVLYKEDILKRLETISIDSSIYDENDKQILLTKIEASRKEIINQDNIEEIKTIYDNLLSELNDYEVNKKDILEKIRVFEEYKDNKINEITSSIILSKYSVTNQVLLVNKLNEVKMSIQNAKTTDEINTSISLFQEYCKMVLTIEEENLQILEAYKKEKCSFLQNYSFDIDNYDETKVNELISQTIEKITNETSIEQIDKDILEFISTIETLKINKGCKSLTNYLSLVIIFISLIYFKRKF